MASNVDSNGNFIANYSIRRLKSNVTEDEKIANKLSDTLAEVLAEKESFEETADQNKEMIQLFKSFGYQFCKSQMQLYQELMSERVNELHFDDTDDGKRFGQRFYQLLDFYKERLSYYRKHKFNNHHLNEFLKNMIIASPQTNRAVRLGVVYQELVAKAKEEVGLRQRTESWTHPSEDFGPNQTPVVSGSVKRSFKTHTVCDCKSNPNSKSDKKCIAFCFKSFQGQFHPDHNALYSVLDKMSVKAYNRFKITEPINDSYVPEVQIEEGTWMSIDVEFLPGKDNRNRAARVAIVGQNIESIRKPSDNKVNNYFANQSKETVIKRENRIICVFHALLRFEGLKFNTCAKAQEHTYVKCVEHTFHPNKSADAAQVVTKLDAYLTRYPIVWKNFASDMLSLMNAGFDFDPKGKHKSVEWYDLERVCNYEAYNKDQNSTNVVPLSLDWLTQHIFLNVPKDYTDLGKSPITDARNHLKVFRKLLKVTDSGADCRLNVRDLTKMTECQKKNYRRNQKKKAMKKPFGRPHSAVPQLTESYVKEYSKLLETDLIDYKITFEQTIAKAIGKAAQKKY